MQAKEMHNIKKEGNPLRYYPKEITMKSSMCPLSPAQKCSEPPVLLGLGILAVGAELGQAGSLGRVSHLYLQVSDSSTSVLTEQN